ncbi:Ada metal-binding domain-containing protein [Micromonospora echinaurantiaca]
MHRREERLDGSFHAAVKTAGTYCRPTCRAKTPRTMPTQQCSNR